MTITVGTRVTVDDPKYPGVWTVAKVNPKTYKLAPVGTDGPGMGRNLVAPHSFVRQAGPDHEGPATGTVTFAPVREPFYAGEVITARGKDGFWVVIADKDRRVNIARLGGDGGRYWRFPPTALTRATGKFIASR